MTRIERIDWAVMALVAGALLFGLFLAIGRGMA
jgi:hypothetical protein